MCLAIPGKIVEIYEEGGLRMGKLDFGGMIRKACLEYVPTAVIGQYALIHVGFALATIEEDEAARTLALLESLGEMDGAFSGSELITTSDQRGAP
jgi:hydrogenase expression/formation protein HypC